MPRATADLAILLVDDQPAVQRAMVKLLATLGHHRVETAANGAEALSLIRLPVTQFEVVICDLSMPTEDGLVFLRNLAALNHQPAVILMSGKDDLLLEAAHRFGESLGVRILGILPKPPSVDRLERLLHASVPEPSPAAVATPLPILLGESEIANALAASRFEVWFQPQLEFATDEIVGVEALLRLRHETYGLLTPASFIKPAEDSGLIQQLLDVALETAVTWGVRWRESGWPLSISVNLSKAGLNDLALPDRVAALCARHGFSPTDLVLELTESTLSSHLSDQLDILTRFRLKGFRLSLDDFGTGYATLDDLRVLPFHELKLDRLFVQGAETDVRTYAILVNSVRLAAELNLTMVAEGIETEQMLRRVEALGCQMAQGYLIGRPMPPSDLVPWLAARRESRFGSRPRKDSARGAVSNTGEVPLPVGMPSQSASHEVARFTHDIASPLTVILTLSEMLKDDDGLPPAFRDDVRGIHQAAEQANQFVRELRRGFNSTTFQGGASVTDGTAR